MGRAERGIRSALADDAEAIARVQIAGWRAAYANIFTPTFLASLDSEERAGRWRERLAEGSAVALVATDDVGTVVGFLHCGPVRDEDVEPGGRAEIYTLYVAPAFWRMGFGAALVDASIRAWEPSGVSEVLLWVFEANPNARAFYERMGFAPDGARRTEDFGGARQVEVRYRRRLG